MASGDPRTLFIPGDSGWQNTSGKDYLIYEVSLFPTNGVYVSHALIAGPDSEPQWHQLGTYRLVYIARYASASNPHHTHFFSGVLKNNEWLYNWSNVHAYISLEEL